MNRNNNKGSASQQSGFASTSKPIVSGRLQTARAFPLPKNLLLLLAVLLGFCFLHTFAIVTSSIPHEYPTYWFLPRAEPYHCDEPRPVA